MGCDCIKTDSWFELTASADQGNRAQPGSEPTHLKPTDFQQSTKNTC